MREMVLNLGSRCDTEKQKTSRKSKEQQQKNMQASVVLRLDILLGAGGACSKCGYDRCLAALNFHHLQPSKKSGEIAKMIREVAAGSAARVDLEIEVAKCELLCANCHREAHASIQCFNWKPSTIGKSM